MLDIYVHLSSISFSSSSSLALLRAVRDEVGDQRVGLGLGDDAELDALGEAAADLF